MSNSDSFIEEVTEEVRRDKLYATFRRYGWIAALVVVLIVGGAAWNEYRKAQTRATAEALGDRILDAMSGGAPESRQAGLETIATDSAGAEVVVSLLAAAEAQAAGNVAAAVEMLDAVAVRSEVPEIYRQVAAFKSLVLQAETMDGDTRRQQLEALAAPGAPFSLLAQEQLALQDAAEGRSAEAIARFQAIVESAGVNADLQQRALQVIVALGGTPDLSTLQGAGN
jgi:hypothetical protein